MITDMQTMDRARAAARGHRAYLLSRAQRPFGSRRDWDSAGGPLGPSHSSLSWGACCTGADRTIHQPDAAESCGARPLRNASTRNSTTPMLMALSAMLNDGQGLNRASGMKGR